VKVTRFTYDDVDKALLCVDETVAPEDAAVFKKLSELAERNIVRRESLGAVSFSMPEIHITVSGESINLESIPSYKSAVIVRECMLLAGEGAASWALKNRLPFPYIIQEIADMPSEILSGIAGAYQMRRCMRPRQLTSKPGLHAGMGIDGYTQVTSPLRRYTDLLAHQQIRAFLRGETVLTEDEILLRLIAGEAAASAVVHSERASKAHWLTVYLSDKIGSTWDAVVLERKGPRVQIIIPALGLETLTAMKGEVNPGDEIKVSVSKCKIPEAEIVVIPV
jgi:exoribonuclease-2